MIFSRMLTSAGPDAMTYIVYRPGDAQALCIFVTDGVNGKTPDETALANLADLSEQTEGELRLHRVQHGRIGAEFSVIIGFAQHGCTREA